MIKSVTLCQEDLNNISIAVTTFLIERLPSYNIYDKVSKNIYSLFYSQSIFFFVFENLSFQILKVFFYPLPLPKRQKYCYFFGQNKKFFNVKTYGNSALSR